MTEHVKIYGIKPRIQYVADGTSTVYEFPFAIFSTSNIDVYFADVKQESDTYTVSEACHSDGGTVTFGTAPESGTIITIVRNLSIERTSDFQEGSTLRAKVLNDELDYQIACQQQIAENLNRSIVLPPYATDNDLDLTLPTPSAGKAIVWNADGTNLENSTVSVNALESTLKGYKESAESAASTATTKAGLASDKADVATSQAQTATTQAGIAAAKADEACLAVNQLNGMRTNCITAIPQDIKLELNNGTLTLKAGSKLYQPNGTGVFSVIDISEDKTRTGGIANKQGMFFWDVYANGIRSRDISKIYSGSTAPSDLNSSTWYDTTNNQIKFYNGSGSVDSSSGCFPLCICTSDSGANIISIDQVFNGFGYIGSTVFALPGVKGLIPNGRNDDGTLKNTSFSTTSVSIYTYATDTLDVHFGINSEGKIGINGAFLYKETENYNMSTTSLTVWDSCECGRYTIASGNITLFKANNVFHPLNYNKLEIIKFCMPDFSAGTSFTSGNKTPYPCAVHIQPVWNGQVSDMTSPYAVRLEGTVHGGSNYYRNDQFFFCDAGTTISFTNATCTIYPLKGV